MGQHSVLVVEKEDGISSMRGWQIDVPTSRKARLRAGQGYEVEI